MLFLFHLVEEQTEPDISRLLSMRCATEACSFQMYKLVKQKVLLLSKYSRYSPAKTRIIFAESSVWSIRRKLTLFATPKTSSESTVCEVSSGFRSVTPERFAVESLHYRILVLRLPRRAFRMNICPLFLANCIYWRSHFFTSSFSCSYPVSLWPPFQLGLEGNCGPFH